MGKIDETPPTGETATFILAEAAPLTSYTTCTSSAEAKSLVIVDETYGTGKSVAATLKVLRENGLQHSDKCKITIAVALKVK